MPKSSRTFVAGFLEHFLASIRQVSGTLVKYEGEGIPTREFENVSDFWRAARQWDPNGPPALYVSMHGAISAFAPVLPGDPIAKRDAHRYVRRNYEEIRNTLARQDHKEGPTTLDAFLAFSAGQMVMRMSVQGMPYTYLGLYHSIVRNSIPLFVETKYLTETVGHALEFNPSPDVIEASVTGRLLPMPDNFVVDFLRYLNLYDVFREAQVDRLLPRFGLQVDAEDITCVTPTGASRYLDGDIWLALRVDGTDRVVSRFLDLSDPLDVAAERGALKTEISQLYRDAKILSEYDHQDRLFPEQSILDFGFPQSGGPSEAEEITAPPSDKPIPDTPIRTINVFAKEFSMSQDRITVHNVGGIVNVKSTLKNAQQRLDGATAMPKAQRAEFQELLQQLGALVGEAEKQHPEEAARVAQTADLLAAEASKKEPDASFLKITSEGLVQAAKALKAAAPSILSVVSSIVRLVVP